MDKVAVIRGTQSNQDDQDALANQGLAASTSAQTATVSNVLPTGALTANADGSITTPGGYTVFNDGNHQWRVAEPDGTQHRIWGDPHVDEGNDGTSDWSFDTDASFVLGDGTKIFCDTDKVSTYGGKDVTTSDMLKIQYQDHSGR